MIGEAIAAPTPWAARPATGCHSEPPGAAIHVVAQRLGHSSPALTLSIYSHVLPRQQAAAAAAFARLVETNVCEECGTSLREGGDELCTRCRRREDSSGS